MTERSHTRDEARELDIVTGAFSYTGKYIARRLLATGREVKTLTGHRNRHDPFEGRVKVAPLDFDNAQGLVETLRGATTLYNTYWIRFERGALTFAKAVENTRILVRSARDAGVRRVVQISITNPSEASPLPYFRGKAEVERAVIESGLTYAILRPTVVFGEEDILINNIAWLLRKFPVFAIPGSGDYRLQPIFAEDVADLAVRAGRQKENTVSDAAGPDTFTFEEMVRLIACTIGSGARIVHMNPGMVHVACRLLSVGLRDVLLTRDEIAGLMGNLLVSEQPPSGRTRLGDWLLRNSYRLGTRYASELARHFR